MSTRKFSTIYLSFKPRLVSTSQIPRGYLVLIYLEDVTCANMLNSRLIWCVFRKSNRYLDDGDNPNDYTIRDRTFVRKSDPPPLSPTTPTSPFNNGSTSFKEENHYAPPPTHVETSAFHNPMYAEGLNLEAEDDVFQPSGVLRHKERHPVDQRVLQAQSRYSMSPIVIGEEGEPTESGYDTMYKTTGTFKDWMLKL